MRPRHANVLKPLHRDTHPVERLDRLFGDRPIGATGRDHRGMDSFARLLRRQRRRRRGGQRRDPQGSRDRIVIGEFETLSNLEGDPAVNASDQRRLTRVELRPDDSRHQLGRFALPINHFAKAATSLPSQIDGGTGDRIGAVRRTILRTAE